MITLVTSNKMKIREIKAAGFPYKVREGADIPEIDTDDPDLVVQYKAIDAGTNKLVEDTILIIDGIPFIDIKYRQDEVPEYIGCTAIWRVSFAYSDGKHVYSFVGQTEGVIVEPLPDALPSFGFNPYFKPLSESKTIADMLGMDPIFITGSRYMKISARVKALTQFLNNDIDRKVSVDQFPEWVGEYQ